MTKDYLPTTTTQKTQSIVCYNQHRNEPAYEEEETAIIVPTTAVTTARADAICGARTADVNEWDCSKSGAKNRTNKTTLKQQNFERCSPNSYFFVASGKELIFVLNAEVGGSRWNFARKPTIGAFQGHDRAWFTFLDLVL